MKISYLLPDQHYEFFKEIIPWLEKCGITVEVNVISNDSDVVVAGIFPCSPQYYLAIKQSLKPYILWEWDHYTFVNYVAEKWRLYHSLLPGATEIWSCSYDAARRLKELFGYDSQVIPAWISPANFVVNSQEDFAFFAETSCAMHKRADWAIRVCDLLDIKLVVSRHQELTRQKYFETLSKCRVYIMPAFEESNASIPAVEAGAMNKAVVTSDLPASREVFGNTAYYFPVWDFVGFKDKVQDAWLSGVKPGCSDRILKNYSIEVVVKKIVDRLKLVTSKQLKSKVLGDATGRIIGTEYGYIEYRYAPGATCEIVNIEVEPHKRRQGTGTGLLAYLLQDKEIKRVFAFTRTNNSNAIAWYRKNGFKITLISDYYPEGDAYLCVKNNV